MPPHAEDLWLQPRPQAKDLRLHRTPKSEHPRPSTRHPAPLSPEILPKELERLAPAVLGGIPVVHLGAVVVEERVVPSWIRREVVGFAEQGQLLVERAHRIGAG